MAPLPQLIVEWGRAAKPGDPLSSITWTDISSWAHSVSFSRGRSNEFSTVEGASSEITLDNRDRRFDPLYSSGPYYPIKLRSRIRARAVWGGNSYNLFHHYLEAIDQDWSPRSERYSRAVMRGVDGFGVLRQINLDIGGEWRNTSFPPGLQRELGRTTGASKWAQLFQVGYASSVDKVSLWLRRQGSPTDNVRITIHPNLGGVPNQNVTLAVAEVSGSSLSTDGGEVSFSINPANLTVNGQYWVVVARTGAADNNNYYLVGADPTSTDPSYWTLQYTTAWAQAPPRLLLALSLAAPEELSGSRINRILDAAGFPPAADRVIDAGQSVVAREVLSGDALSMILDTVRSERGVFFCDGAGRVVYHDRHRRLKGSYLTSKATFGDAPGELRYAGIGGDYDLAQVRNRVSLTPTGKSKQTAEDSTSIADYGVRSLDEEVKLTSEAEALDQANYLVATYKQPQIRFDEIRVLGDSDPTNLWPAILGLELGDRVTVRRRPQGVGSAISVDQHVEGISHRIQPGSWDTTLRVSPANDPAVNSFWILGDAQYGVLGSTTRLAY